MIYIKRFIEKVSLIESRNNKDVVLPISEARGLRDELSKLLVDLYDINATSKKEEPITQVIVKGSSFNQG